MKEQQTDKVIRYHLPMNPIETDENGSIKFTCPKCKTVIVFDEKYPRNPKCECAKAWYIMLTAYGEI